MPSISTVKARIAAGLVLAGGAAGAIAGAVLTPIGKSVKRTPTLMLGCLVLPMTLAAQQPSTPAAHPPENPISETVRGFGYYGGWLLAAFDSIPASQYGFRPTPSQQSVGYIAQHLENANYELCARFGGVPRPVTAKDSLADTMKAAWPKDTLVARLRASFLVCRDAAATLTDAGLAEELPRDDGPAGRQAPRARFVLLFLTDLADHYSQVANYMRALGLVPPSAARTSP
jgi:uncharacterized damage-inducible protein DinB